MSIRHLIVVAVLLAGALLAGVGLGAQVQPRRAPVEIPIDPNMVITGQDIGFLPVGLSGSTPMGRLVVRVKGKWVDAQLSGGKLTPIQ